MEYGIRITPVINESDARILSFYVLFSGYGALLFGTPYSYLFGYFFLFCFSPLNFLITDNEI